MVRILAIESSCDETSAAVVECGGGLDVKSNCIASQIERHKLFGGVVPEIASRMHIECISSVVDEALAQAECTFDDIDAVVVTYAPGLVGALLVGVNYAKSLAYALQKPLIPVHHIEGHIFANLISNPELKPPFLCLVASGGHSSIVHVQDYNKFEVLAKTRDDAAGEAFDKVARVLGLGYPGGPAIQKTAMEGDAKRFAFPKVSFDNSADFSFSGVKTAVINTVHQMEQKGEKIPTADVAASFQEAVCSVLAERLFDLARKIDVQNVTLAGGVAANQCLRDKCTALAKRDGRQFGCPPLILCTDNAAMIAARGYYALLDGKTAGTDLNAVATKDITVKR